MLFMAQGFFSQVYNTYVAYSNMMVSALQGVWFEHWLGSLDLFVITIIRAIITHLPVLFNVYNGIMKDPCVCVEI